MSSLGLWVGVLVGLCIGHSHGWFWLDESKDKSVGTPTPAYVTTLGKTDPATVATTEYQSTKGTDALDVDVLAKGEEKGSEGGSSIGSAWNEQSKAEAKVEHGSGLEPDSGSWNLSGSGVEPESEPTIKSETWSPLQEINNIQTNLSTGGDNIHAVAEDMKLEKNLTKEDLSETAGTVAPGDPILSQLNISINISSESVSGYRNISNSNSSNWHADLNNMTQYSHEYSVSNDLLTVESNQSFSASEAPATESPHCLLVDFDLPFCHSLKNGSFTIPNFLNQSSVEDVQSFLGEWAFLIQSDCHNAVEWFFCLLAMPRCGVPGLSPQMPCRSFCELLIDNCWTLLEDRRLPVECSSLPEEGDDGNQCLSISTQKGKGGLECHLSFQTIEEMHSEPAATCL
ncbi:collagen type XVIII alpha 1 chain a isoform X1 [Tachysurus ichikawai]